MALVKTEAIILRAAKMGETSKLLTVYSLRDGVLKLVAKGARSSKSRMAGTLESLHVVEIVYYEKANRDLQLLSQAAIVFAPKNLLREPERLVMAMVCAELVARLETVKAGNPPVYGLLRAALEAFNDGACEPRLLLLAFALQLLRYLGFAPSIDHCSVCGKKESPMWKFHIGDAKLCCNECMQTLHSGLFLSGASLRGLQRLNRTPLTALRGAMQGEANLVEIYKFLTAFYEHHLEEVKFLRSIQVLKQMKSGK